jgi:hypothetical protein
VDDRDDVHSCEHHLVYQQATKNPHEPDDNAVIAPSCTSPKRHRQQDEAGLEDRKDNEGHWHCIRGQRALKDECANDPKCSEEEHAKRYGADDENQPRRLDPKQRAKWKANNPA